MKKRRTIIILLIVLICIIYLATSTTYTSYESNTSAKVESDIASWNIKVNDTLITTATTQEINIDTINWNTEHIREGTAAPGTSGSLEITIDPTDTDVSFDYELTIIDHTVDENKLLSVTSVTSARNNLTQEGNVYRGTMSLSDIKQDIKEVITINLLWDDKGEDTVIIPGEEEPTTDDFIELDFRAIQRK